jgi:aryl-alcohol dehydrogenase-like predicted oxidoreductase
LAVLQAVASETGATLNQVILAWMLQIDPVVIPLVAAGTTDQMAENLGALTLDLSPDQIDRLNTAAA